MNIREQAESIEAFIIERRRFYHARPECSGSEAQTTASIAEDLRGLGLEPRFFDGFYGLTARIKGAHPGPTVALRADIDALNTIEKTGLPFASKNGRMHACGHDAHIAMQLGATKLLCENRSELYGDVLLLFQPEEETATGAAKVFRSGVLDGVSAIYGTHIWGALDAPLIDVSSGPRMAANMPFEITIRGLSAHGSTPHLGKDAITAACSVVMELQLLATRMNNALEPFVLTVGTIHGGTMYNSIADHVQMEGTVRHFNKAEQIQEKMTRIIHNTCEGLGVEAEVHFQEGTLPLINSNEGLNRIARDALVHLYGESAVGNLPMMMSSEDYSTFMDKIPGIFTFIGSRNTEKGFRATNHQNTYTVDESALKRGAALAAQFALDHNREFSSGVKA